MSWNRSFDKWRRKKHQQKLLQECGKCWMKIQVEVSQFLRYWQNKDGLPIYGVVGVVVGGGGVGVVVD